MATLDARASDRGFFDAVAQKTSHPSFVELSLRETLPAIPVSWAIDDGVGITTLSTSAVWTGLASGVISPLFRVWREGMEAWEPILDVPELSCALVGFDPARAEALALAASGERTPAPDLTPAPITTPVSEPPPSLPARPDRTGLLGVAAAVAVALAILASPLRGTGRTEEARAGGASTLARRAALLAASTPEAAPLEPYFPQRTAPSASAPPAERAKPERGQKRRRKQ